MSDFWTERIETQATVEDWRIFLNVHRSEESYGWDSMGIERPYLSHREGCKTYVLAKPCILQPRFTLTATLHPESKGREIGEVTNVDWEGMDTVEVGRAQAWHYHPDGVLVLWECYLFAPWREGERPAHDARHRAVWQAFEDALVKWFEPRLILTPGWEPIYEQGAWQAFLRKMGYRLDGNVGLKARDPDSGS